MAILNGRPRTATAIVVEDARCLVIDAKTLETMISKSPEIALRLIKKLAKRLDSADEIIQILLNPDPQARVMLGAEAPRRGVRRGDADRRAPPRSRRPSSRARSGIDVRGRHDVLARLGRLRIAGEDEAGTRSWSPTSGGCSSSWSSSRCPRRFSG